MLDSLLEKRDVQNFINEVINNPIYSEKKSDIYSNAESFNGPLQILFVVLDAIYKYQVIIGVDYYFEEYFLQLQKLLKKIDSFQDITMGINLLLGNMCALKLGLTDEEDKNKQILKYVYDRYIVNGYVFHGYNGIYQDKIKVNGFVPEEYNHSYDEFKKIDKMFTKQGLVNVMNKDFNNKTVYFTDSFLMACYYGYNAPMYLYKLLGGIELNNKNYSPIAYTRNNYLAAFNNLNMLMKKYWLLEAEKKKITKTCVDEWKLIKKNNKVNILAIKRSLVGMDSLKNIDDIINNSDDLGEGISKIVNTFNNKIEVKNKIDSRNISFINMDNYLIEEEKEEKTSKREVVENGLNAYGKVSTLMILGSLLITLGVIISIIMISRG